MDISSIYPGCILLTGWWWRGWRMMMVTTLILGQEDGQDGGGLTWARSLVEWWQFSTFATLIVAFDTLSGNCDNDDNDGDKVDSQQFHQAATSSQDRLSASLEKWVGETDYIITITRWEISDGPMTKLVTPVVDDGIHGHSHRVLCQNLATN